MLVKEKTVDMRFHIVRIKTLKHAIYHDSFKL